MIEVLESENKIADLSEAVIHWLEYQRCIGIDGLLNESALTIPIVGYLTSKGWETKKETDYAKICNSVTQDKCFADFYFAREDERLLVETKLYKGSPQNKLFDDLVRLALPINQSLKRLALIAFSKDKKFWGPYKAILELVPSGSVGLDVGAVALIHAGTAISLNYNAKEFARLCGYTLEPLSTIGIVCEQRTESKKYAAVVLSVTRGCGDSPSKVFE